MIKLFNIYSGLGRLSWRGFMSRRSAGSTPAPASILLAIVACAVLGGCVTRTVVKPVPTTITKYVKQTIPKELLRACRVYEPDPACVRDTPTGVRREFCNDQLLYVRGMYRRELALCDSDKTELRKRFGSGK